ncbi:MAG: hypothetical protein O3A46_15925 [Candidatus Poribacteria bacterium]|nr:hypothetical protein [Candidatus Poribacteria bacterium]
MSKNTPIATARERLGRVLIVGSLLTALQCYWIVVAEAIWFAVHLTVQSIAFTSVFGLVALSLVNIGLKAIHPRLSFTKPELLLVYVMMTIGAGMAGHGFMQLLLPLKGHAHWYASTENDWGELFLQYLPDWLVVSDPAALKDHYLGESTFYTREHLRVWAKPIFWWTTFIMAFALVHLGIVQLVRKQWVEQEKLTYPIIQLPLELISEPKRLASRPLFWGGFVVAAGFSVLNELSLLVPSVPYVHLKLTNIGWWFSEKPWDAVGWLPVSFYPFAVGLGYFIPLDLLFSSWFFYLFWKGQRVLMAASGTTARGGSFSGFQGIIEQSTGAYMAVGVMAVWVSRRHLAAVWRTVRGKDRSLDESDEPMSYNAALTVILLAFVFLIGFSVRAGMSLWLAVPFFLVYFLINFSITRMRAEMGVPVHDMHNGGPDQLFPPMFGARRLGARNLTVMAQYWFFNRAHYSDFQPGQLEGFKLSERVGGRNRSMWIALVVSVFVGVVATFWAFLDTSHRVGMAGRVEWFGWEPLNRLAVWLTVPEEPSPSTPIFVAVGAATTFFFAFMRTRFIWWPLHPAGYAVSNSWGMATVWFPLLIAWAVKGALLKFGGLGIYRRGMPFFMGLMMGDFIVGSFLSVTGTALNTRVYAFWVY